MTNSLDRIRARLFSVLVILLVPVSGSTSTDLLHIDDGEILEIGEGHLIISGDGIVNTDSGTVNVSGNDSHMTLTENATLIVVNGATLHFLQTYLHEHTINAHDLLGSVGCSADTKKWSVRRRCGR